MRKNVPVTATSRNMWSAQTAREPTTQASSGNRRTTTNTVKKEDGGETLPLNLVYWEEVRRPFWPLHPSHYLSALCFYFGEAAIYSALPRRFSVLYSVRESGKRSVPPTSFGRRARYSIRSGLFRQSDGAPNGHLSSAI